MHTHKDKATAKPQKGFFINMLTKDISLTDCILDLLDNCVDGANAHVRLTQPETQNVSFTGYSAKILITENKFTITDNCGGIPVQTAKDIAFNFGSPPGKGGETKHSIGFYGIGMKRAIFKIGNSILIRSSTGTEAFVANIEVEDWSHKEGDWDFEIDVYDDLFPKKGTEIEIEEIYSPVASDFGNSSFITELMNIIERDYMFILSKGFEIRVNGVLLKPATLALISSEDFRPLRYKNQLKTIKGGIVDVELIAGVWNFSGQDDDQELTEFDSGWYVICNDRVVLAADKSDKTGWGKNKPIGRKWHSQYKPFVGFAIFSSDDPRLLPWNTTKRGVDLTSEIYRQALVLMGDATKPAIQYTNMRKKDPGAALKFENETTRESLLNIKENKILTFPTFEQTTTKTNTVTYHVDERRLQKAKEAMGNPLMTSKELGEGTFDYYYNNEVGE